MRGSRNGKNAQGIKQEAVSLDTGTLCSNCFPHQTLNAESNFLSSFKLYVSMTSVILSCPAEVIWEILRELIPDYKSLLRCRLACRQFRTIIDSSVQLQLELKLEAYGYKLSSPPFPPQKSPSISSTDLLKKLDTHIEAWRTLNWEETKQSLTDCSHIYNFAHGYFVSVRKGNYASIICMQLPSRLMGTEMRIFTIEDVGFVVCNLAIDPSQDLLVLLEMYVDLLLSI